MSAQPQPIPFRSVLPYLGAAIVMLTGVGLLGLIQQRPLIVGNSFLRIDGLSALTMVLAGLTGLTVPPSWRRIGQLGALCIALLSGHLIGLALGSLIGTVLSEDRRYYLSGAGMAAGYLLIGAGADSWWLEFSGTGLNSISFVLLLAGAVIAVGGIETISRRESPFDPLIALIGLTTLLRLYSVGPWNLGWQFATLLAGSALALGTAWRAVTAGAAQIAESWLQRAISGLAMVAVGCATSAGVVAAGLILLHLCVRRLGDPASGIAPWAGWMLSGAVPGTLGFIAFWAVSAAAMAARIAVLAIVVWTVALLLILAAGRNIAGQHRQRSSIVALISLGGGLASPWLARWLLRPLSDHLQGGLTPYGTIEPWGWAGLLALDAGSRTAATAPGLALLALLGLIGALAWLMLRWRRGI
ncbi:hypothetical protein [Chloroflexus sp.]|uniref:hypothetical protein n=1 Tax=Chloroflexus sp. TaxID=1904827 RepID=UPI004049B254